MKKYLYILSFVLFSVSFSTIQAQCPVSNSCTPGTAGDLLFDAGIKKVILSNINKTSSNNASGYQNFSCSDSSSLKIGTNYTITIQNSTINEDVKVWIDLDNNGTFGSVSELVFESLNKLSHSGTISIANGAVLNTPLRMRISSDNSSSTFSNPITPCSTPQNGQVEDYAIYLRPNTSKPETEFISDIQHTTCDGIIKFTDKTSNTPTSWKWYFGDGDSSTTQHPTHSYSSTGIYNVTLITENAYGIDTLKKTNFITFNESLTTLASCTPNTSSYCCNYGILKVILGTINQSSGNASEGYIDFSCLNSTSIVEGTPTNMTLQTNAINHDFHIYLDANNDGIFNENTELIKIILGKQSPTESLIIPSSSLKDIPLRLRICADSEGETIQACGNLSKGQCEDYTVIVTSNPNPPIANFTVDNEEKCDSFFQFTNLSQNNIDSVLWNFGDGTTSNALNPLHIYKEEGIYTVSLTIINAYGTDTIEKINYITRAVKPKELCSIYSQGPQWANVGINNFIFKNIINNTAINNTNEYKDYTCDFTAKVNAGEKYDVTVYTGNDGDEQVVIYIDYNNDGEINFGEKVYSEIAFVQHKGTITIPPIEDVVLDTKLRMRVISGAVGGGGPMGGNGVQGPCEDVVGEVEDYSIIISNPNSIDEIADDLIKIFPNPNNGNFSIESNITIDEVKIYSSIGELLFTKNNINISHVSINNKFEQGLYFVEIKIGNQIKLKKLIIN